MKARRKVPVLLLFVVMATVAIGAVPSRISYQGSLTASGGAAIPDAAYKMRFTMFDDPSAGTQLWQETQTGVAVTGGLFSVELGAATALPASVFNAANLYLEVEVDLNGNTTFESGEKYAPRQHITSGAYARVAERIPGGAQYDALVAPSGGDYTTIQAALAAGKKTIFVRNGTYVLSSFIDITSSGTVIMGESRDGVIIDCNGTGNAITALGDMSPYDIGTVSVTNGSNTVTGVGTSWATNVAAGEYIQLGGDCYKIQSVDSDTQLTLVETYQGRSLAGAAYQIASMLENIRLENLTVRNTTSGGAIIWYWVLNCQIINCAAEKNASNGIWLWEVYHCKLNKNFARHNTGDGIRLEGCQDNALFENSSVNNGAYGIILYSSSNNNTVSGNSCNNNDENGICLNISDNNTVSGNLCQDNAPSGIWLNADADANTLVGNVSTGNGSYGINIGAASCDDNIVIGNQFNGNGSGAFINSGTGSDIAHNKP